MKLYHWSTKNDSNKLYSNDSNSQERVKIIIPQYIIILHCFEWEEVTVAGMCQNNGWSQLQMYTRQIISVPSVSLFCFYWSTQQLQQSHIISPTPSSTPAVRSWSRASGAHPSPLPEASSEHAHTYKKGGKKTPTTRRQDKGSGGGAAMPKKREGEKKKATGMIFVSSVHTACSHLSQWRSGEGLGERGGA